MPTHEAGWAHADGALRGPAGCASPPTPTSWSPGCGRARPTRSTDTWWSAGSRCPTWSPTSTLRRTCSTRPTSGPAPAPSATRSRRYDVFYAGKAFLCTTVARWVAEEGLCLDVCSDGELTVALRAGFDPARIGYHGNNKTEPELAPRRGRGRRAGSSSTPSTRSSGSSGSPPTWGATAGDGPGDRRRRGPHPRVHRHRPRGPEVRLLDHLRRRPRRRTTGGRRAGPRAARPALPHRLPDLRLLRLRGGGPSGARAARAGLRESA